MSASGRSNDGAVGDVRTRAVSRYVRLRVVAQGLSRFTLDAQASPGESLQQRFIAETGLLAQARHPHLLRGVVDGGRSARFSETLSAFVPSDTDWLAGLSLYRRLLMFAQLASALGALHRGGLVHGVLHPDRCGVRANGDLVLLDLGRVWSDDAGRGGGDDLSHAAPECLAGQAPDPRADVYSLGLLLYRFGAAAPLPRRGAPAFSAELVALQPLLDAMLSAAPAQRPGSVTMLLDRLNTAIMRAPALADRLERERQPDETPIERAIAVLSMQSQNAAFGATAAALLQGAERWQARVARSRAGLALRVGLVLVTIAAASVYAIRTRAPAEMGLVESLTRTAQNQLDAGHVLLPPDDNALDTLRTLRGIDPAGAATAALAQRIRAQAPAAVEQAIAAEAFDAADAALSRALRAFPDEAALAALSDRMAVARRESAQREQRRELLARLDALLAAETVDDAQWTQLWELMEKARVVAPDAAHDASDLAERRARVEALTVARARAALEADDLAVAEAVIRRLHDAFSASGELAALEAEYRRRAGASRQQQVVKLLQDAAAAEQGGDAVAVANALDAYLAASRLMPEDAAARDGAARIGRRALARAGDTADADDARRWLVLAKRVLPPAETTALDTRIAQQGRDETAARETLIARAELAARRGNYFGAGDDSAIALYRQAGDAASPQRRQGIARLRESALKDADALIAQRRYDEAAALVDAALANLGSDAEFGRRKLTLASLQSRAAPDAASAVQGTLSINAIPWARVQSVVSVRDGHAAALDAEATTPLRLTLPAGDYVVALGDPVGGTTRHVNVRVAANDGASITVNLRETPPAAVDAARSEP
jgi:hypothetical protein